MLLDQSELLTLVVFKASYETGRHKTEDFSVSDFDLGEHNARSLYLVFRLADQYGIKIHSISTDTVGKPLYLEVEGMIAKHKELFTLEEFQFVLDTISDSQPQQKEIEESLRLLWQGGSVRKGQADLPALRHLDVLTFQLDISTEAAERVSSKLDEYITLFMAGRIKTPYSNHLSYSYTRQKALESLRNLVKQFGKSIYWQPSHVTSLIDFKHSGLRFLELGLAFEKEGLITIKEATTIHIDGTSFEYPCALTVEVTKRGLALLGGDDNTHLRVQFSRGTLLYGKEKYSPNKNEKREIVRMLWERKAVKNLKGEFLEGRKGSRISFENLAMDVYPRDAMGSEYVKKDVEDIARQLREKNMPLSISSRGGVLLTETIQD